MPHSQDTWTTHSSLLSLSSRSNKNSSPPMPLSCRHSRRVHALVVLTSTFELTSSCVQRRVRPPMRTRCAIASRVDELAHCRGLYTPCSALPSLDSYLSDKMEHPVFHNIAHNLSHFPSPSSPRSTSERGGKPTTIVAPPVRHQPNLRP